MSKKGANFAVPTWCSVHLLAQANSRMTCEFLIAGIAVCTCCLFSSRKRKITKANSSNSRAFDALGWRKPILNDIMEALADPNTHSIGVYGTNDEIKGILLQRVYRRVQREKLFNVFLTATVTKKPNVKRIQEEIACQLGFNFTYESKDKRARELRGRIKNEQSILIVLCGLHKSLNLDKVGIPIGADHTGCKILLTSICEEVLSIQMHTQKNFLV